jgi:hypothetical protein
MSNTPILHGVNVAAAALAFAFLTGAAAQEPTATTLAPAVMPGAADVAETERECRNLRRPGSRIAEHACRTAAEWAAIAQVKAARAARAVFPIAYPHETDGRGVTPVSVIMNR